MPSDPSTDNRLGYDRWSQLYDGYVNSTVASDDLTFPQVFATLRDVDVLEIGCGTGRHTLRLAQQGNRVTALDLSPGMLSVARAKLAAFDTVQLIEADIMEHRDWGRFDAVLTALVLEHIADLTVFLNRVSAALKPDGRFYMSEIHPERIAGGTQANFVADDGQHIRLTSFAHSGAAIETAASQAGLVLDTVADVIGGDELVAINPDWERHRGRKMLRLWVFKPSGHPSAPDR